jgi:hypothetical protein
MIDVWVVIQEVSYPNTGPGGEPMLRIDHQVAQFEGGDCKFGRGLEVVGIFDSDHEARAYVSSLESNGVILYDPPTATKAGELPESQQPTFRVFLMLEELHRRGYEQLRLVPGMSGTGLAYRSSITAALNVYSDHGAMAVDQELVAAQTSANGEALFGWQDAADASLSELARMFIRRFAKVARLGRAPDAAYAAWFRSALACARSGDFPVAYDSESYGRTTFSEGRYYLPTLGAEVDVLLMPPAGLHQSRLSLR